MPTLFGILNVGKTALLSSQKAMSVTGENLANINTPGYVRRRPVLQEDFSYAEGHLYFGTGVQVKEIERVVDKVLDKRVTLEKGENGFWSALEDVASSVETVFNEPQGLGLSDSLIAFWDAWQALSSNPEGKTERDAVVEKAQQLVGNFQEIRRSLENVVNDGVENIKNWVVEVNTLVKEIADLNKRIKYAEVGDKKINDLKDKLYYKLKKLSELTGAYYTEGDDGVQVYLDNGVSLVEGDKYREIEFEEGDFLRKEVGILNNIVYRKEALFEKRYMKLTVSGEDITKVIKGKMGGTINGLINMADHYLAEVDRLFSELAYRVNMKYVAGIGLTPVSSYTSEAKADDPSKAIRDAEGLFFRDRLTAGAFEIRVWDKDGNLVESRMIEVNPDDSLLKIADKINKMSNVKADVTSDGRLSIYTTAGYVISFSEDTSGFLVSMGINTFFVGDNINNLDVSASIKANHMLVAAGSTPNIGDNRVALEIANLAFGKFMDGDRTFGEFYDAMVGEIGAKTARVKDIQDDTEKFLNFLQDKWDEISGVNIDEEMTNLLKFQRAYEAAARYITTVDEMMNRVINGMGLVGR